VLGEKQQCIYITCVGAFYYHYHFSLSPLSFDLVARNGVLKGRRFGSASIGMVFFFLFVCFALLFPSLCSFSFFHLWPFSIHFPLVCTSLTGTSLYFVICVCVLIALGPDFQRSKFKITNFLGYFAVQGVLKLMSVCRGMGRSEIFAGSSSRVLYTFHVTDVMMHTIHDALSPQYDMTLTLRVPSPSKLANPDKT
jgi:hypothetical protein